MQIELEEVSGFSCARAENKCGKQKNQLKSSSNGVEDDWVKTLLFSRYKRTRVIRVF
jgi:hypothetical protein